jgi:hypothetical protein
MAGSVAVFGVRSRFEVQHWHVNGNFALATLPGLCFDIPESENDQRKVGPRLPQSASDTLDSFDPVSLVVKILLHCSPMIRVATREPLILEVVPGWIEVHGSQDVESSGSDDESDDPSAKFLSCTAR